MDASTRSPSVTTACRFGSKVIVKECVAQTAVAVPTCREAGPAASAATAIATNTTTAAAKVAARTMSHKCRSPQKPCRLPPPRV